MLLFIIMFAMAPFLTLLSCRVVKSTVPSIDPARFVAQVRALVPVAHTPQVRMVPTKCTLCLRPPPQSRYTNAW